jgi:hypothetical protein
MPATRNAPDSRPASIKQPTWNPTQKSFVRIFQKAKRCGVTRSEIETMVAESHAVNSIETPAETAARKADIVQVIEWVYR